ncbi:MAG: hypothetical protein WC003_13020 [Terrimicrobiaceae bacterium]
MRAFIAEDPFARSDTAPSFWERGRWPCRWIAVPEARPPCFCAFRRMFSIAEETVVRVHVSADERYELFLDGRRIGLGPERGDRENWFFETYDLPLAPGEHCLVARVTALGDIAPFAQMSVAHGFLLAADDDRWSELLSTGVANWEAKRLGGCEFARGHHHFSPYVGPNLVVDGGRFDWDFPRGGGNGWRPVESAEPPLGGRGFPTDVHPGMRFMRPAPLPPMMDAERAIGVARFVGVDGQDRIVTTGNLPVEAEAWTDLLQQGAPLEVPPRTARRIVIDLENYYCAYPQIVVNGGRGSRIELAWAEALYLDKTSNDKGNRNEIDGRFFRGTGDVFLPDGGPSRTFGTHWWRAGRYVLARVQTGDEPLAIERLVWRETRYPLEMESRFTASDARLSRVIPIALRCLQMDAHDTFADSPYYEQLMYLGDTRIEALTLYTVTRDARLARKALQMFDSSRLANGLTQSRYPSRIAQVIPPFSLWWVAMIHDYASWRGDRALIASLAPGARGVMDAFLRHRNDVGLIEALPGWNFTDWAPEWRPHGIPPDGDTGASGVLNWHFVLVLRLLAELEDYLAEPELAARWRRLAAEFAERLTEVFWDEERGLFADDAAHERFSEHTQCLAILGGQLEPSRLGRVAASLLQDRHLARTTIYFTHYLFETYRVIGRIDALLDRLGLWFDLDRLGFKTTFEEPEPSRSDCHAWGAHPLYHCFATILGIRPGSMEFQTVDIAPQPGSLTRASGAMAHPLGKIEVAIAMESDGWNARIALPPKLGGTFSFAGKHFDLPPGAAREIRLPASTQRPVDSPISIVP